MTTNVSKPQVTSKGAMKAEAMKTPSANDALKRDALAEPTHYPEHYGAAHRIRGTRPGPDTSAAGQRSGVITSIPVSTNWEAIEGVFASRTTQRKVERMQANEGGTD